MSKMLLYTTSKEGEDYINQNRDNRATILSHVFEAADTRQGLIDYTIEACNLSIRVSTELVNSLIRQRLLVGYYIPKD